jgi:hypothetical protein
MTELREPLPPSPPAPAPAGWQGILEPGERLVWSAQKPKSVLLVPLIWAVIGASIFTALAANYVPTTWSVAAYCNTTHSSRCGVAFFVMWPTVIYFGACAIIILFGLPSVAKSHTQLCYAITSSRALRQQLGKPKSLSAVYLKGAKAERNFLGNFRVRKSKYVHVTFHGLGDKELEEATMAAIDGGAEKWPW